MTAILVYYKPEEQLVCRQSVWFQGASFPAQPGGGIWVHFQGLQSANLAFIFKPEQDNTWTSTPPKTLLVMFVLLKKKQSLIFLSHKEPRRRKLFDFISVTLWNTEWGPGVPSNQDFLAPVQQIHLRFLRSETKKIPVFKSQNLSLPEVAWDMSVYQMDT